MAFVFDLFHELFHGVFVNFRFAADSQILVRSRQPRHIQIVQVVTTNLSESDRQTDRQPSRQTGKKKEAETHTPTGREKNRM